MQFPEGKSESFTTEDIELLMRWRIDMEQTPEGKKFIENFESERYVPEDVWIKFLKNLIGQINEGNRGVFAIDGAIENDMLLKGPHIEKKNLPEVLSKPMKIVDLLKYIKNNIPIFSGKKGQEQMCKLIQNKRIDINNDFKETKLQGRKPIVWATFADEVEKMMLITGNINDFCDTLGLLDFNKCDYIVELRYKTENVKNIRFPTIMEAGTNPTFHPSDIDDEYGYSWDLRSGDWGIPQVVHAPIFFQEIDSIHYLGHKNKNATSLF